MTHTLRVGFLFGQTHKVLINVGPANGTSGLGIRSVYKSQILTSVKTSPAS